MNEFFFILHALAFVNNNMTNEPLLAPIYMIFVFILINFIYILLHKALYISNEFIDQEMSFNK